VGDLAARDAGAPRCVLSLGDLSGSTPANGLPDEINATIANPLM
jgi:hypothetical protein